MDQDEPDRREVVGNVLRPVLEEGEQYTVFCHEGEVYVRDADTSVASARHPRLYGRLLSLSTQLEQAGAGLGRIPLMLALTFCVGLELKWFHDWFDAAQNLADWKFYILLFFFVFQGLNVLTSYLQRSVYTRHREEVYSMMAQESLDRNLLVALIEGDPALERVNYFLKLDPDAPGPNETSRLPDKHA